VERGVDVQFGAEEGDGQQQDQADEELEEEIEPAGDPILLTVGELGRAKDVAQKCDHSAAFRCKGTQ
jgi:hypothetical protein